MQQTMMFSESENFRDATKTYRPILTVTENRKGVLDVDTVKGCYEGMRVYPNGGCYGECYAFKAAIRYGIDFTVSISRKLIAERLNHIFYSVRNHPAAWYRIGVAGDPCHDWENTLEVCDFLKQTGKIPVIVTKHWIPLSDSQCEHLARISAVVNTSTSGLDTESEIIHRVSQINRLRDHGIVSACRVVTCAFGSSRWAKDKKAKQDYLLSLSPVIDTPLRISRNNPRLISGDIKIPRSETC